MAMGELRSLSIISWQPIQLAIVENVSTFPGQIHADGALKLFLTSVWEIGMNTTCRKRPFSDIYNSVPFSATLDF